MLTCQKWIKTIVLKTNPIGEEYFNSDLKSRHTDVVEYLCSVLILTFKTQPSPRRVCVSQSIKALLTRTKPLTRVQSTVLQDGSDYLSITAVMAVKLGSFFSLKSSSAVS